MPDDLELQHRLLHRTRIAVLAITVLALLELAGLAVAVVGLFTDRYTGWDALGALLIGAILGIHAFLGLPTALAMGLVRNRVRRELPMTLLPLLGGAVSALLYALAATGLGLSGFVDGPVLMEAVLFGIGAAAVSAPAWYATYGFIRLMVLRRRMKRTAEAAELAALDELDDLDELPIAATGD